MLINIVEVGVKLILTDYGLSFTIDLSIFNFVFFRRIFCLKYKNSFPPFPFSAKMPAY